MASHFSFRHIKCINMVIYNLIQEMKKHTLLMAVATYNSDLEIYLLEIGKVNCQFCVDHMVIFMVMHNTFTLSVMILDVMSNEIHVMILNIFLQSIDINTPFTSRCWNSGQTLECPSTTVLSLKWFTLSKKGWPKIQSYHPQHMTSYIS